MVEGWGGRRGSHKGHRPTFTRAHTKDEIEKISKARTGKPLSKAHADSISNSMSEYWKPRKAQQALKAQNVPQEETVFTPDIDTKQSN